MIGAIQADQDTSFQAMDTILPAIGQDRRARTRRSTPSTASPAAAEQQRAHVHFAEAAGRAKITRTRSSPACAQAGAVPGATLFLQAVQDLRVGGRRAMRSISSRCAATTCTD